MMPSSASVLLILALVVYTIGRTISNRNLAIVGYAFLTHALGIFKETKNNEHEVDMLVDIAMPHINDLRYDLSSRVFWLTGSVTALAVLLWATASDVDSAGILVVGIMASMYGGWSLSKTLRAKGEIDEVCDACDEDLKEIGRPDEYQVMLNGYMDKPVD